ncbi:hypothetical protein AB4144_23520, partial [Rhizobiaceae sp. 2RAB30]
AVNILTLTAAQILALGDLGIDTLAVGSACGLRLDQLLAVAEAGIGLQIPGNIVLGDAAEVISGLSAQDLSAIVGLGITKFQADADVYLTKAQADAFLAAGLTSDSLNVSVYMTAAEIGALSAAERADLVAAKFLYLASETGQLSLSLSVIQGLMQDGLHLRGTATVTGTAAEIAGIGYADYSVFKDRGIDFLHVTTGAATFDIDVSFAVMDSGLKFTDSDLVTVEAYSLDWDLGDYSFAAIKAAGIDMVKFSTSVELTLTDALAATGSGLTFTSDDAISLVANAGEIQSIRNLTAAQFTALGQLGVDLLVIPNGNVITLDLTQVLAMAGTGMAFGPGFTAYLTTSSFNLGYVTAAQWTAMGETGLD